MVQSALAVAAVILGAFALLAIRRARRVVWLVRRLRSLTTAPIADATDGPIRVQGRVTTPAPILSPFRRRPCAYYAYRVEDVRADRPKPQRLAVGKDWASFGVLDASGTAEVDGRPALIRAPHEHVERLGRLEGVPAQHAEFFEAAGITERHLRRFQDLRVVEYTLEAGDEVHVLGTVRVEDGRKVFYRAAHSPLAVSAAADAGLVPGYRNELLLFSVCAGLFTLFAVFFAAVAFA